MMLVVQDSWPRIVCLGENPGCPCGGTHVADISEIGDVKVVHSTFCVFDITSWSTLMQQRLLSYQGAITSKLCQLVTHVVPPQDHDISTMNHVSVIHIIFTKQIGILSHF